MRALLCTLAVARAAGAAEPLDPVVLPPQPVAPRIESLAGASPETEGAPAGKEADGAGESAEAEAEGAAAQEEGVSEKSEADSSAGSGEDDPDPESDEAVVDEAAASSRFGSPFEGGLLAGVFQPETPTPLQYDWIRLQSGEWLKGEILLMRSQRFEFDSDELDELEFDWEDIAEIRTIRVHSYLLEGRRVETGVGQLVGETLFLEAEKGPIEIKRRKLVAIIPGKPRELNYWSVRASLGMTLRRGNTDQVEFQGYAKVRREDSFTRANLDYVGTVGELNGESNANTHRGTARLDVFLSRRLFVSPVVFEGFHDEFANIAYRLSPGVAVGYELVNRSRFDWEATLGGSYRYTEFVSVEPGEASSDTTGLFIVGTTIESELSRRVDLDLEYSLRLGVPDVSKTDQYFLGVLSVEMTRLLDLDVSFSWDRNQSPTADSNGIIPERDDFRLVVGLAVEY